MSERKDTPPCMDAAEFASWHEANEQVRRGMARSPCADCTADFAKEMTAIGRCEPDLVRPGPPLPSRKTHDAILALGAQGLPYAEIARRLGVHRTTVRKHILNPNAVTADERAERSAALRREMLRLYSGGMSLEGVARKLNCSSTWVRTCVRRETAA